MSLCVNILTFRNFRYKIVTLPRYVGPIIREFTTRLQTGFFLSTILSVLHLTVKPTREDFFDKKHFLHELLVNLHA